MSDKVEGTVTALLDAVHNGESNARSDLWSLVYDEMRTIAASLMRREQPGHIIQPTALVHEAYLRLLGGNGVKPRDRAYFFAAVAQAMRRILIAHAKKPREGSAATLSLDRLTTSESPSTADSISALDGALDELAEHNEQVYNVIMLRFFAGMTVESSAEALEISTRTIKRCWAYGRTWLYTKMST